MEKIQSTHYSHRFLARIIIEAKTPLAVGKGEKDIITDALVATDVNDLPYIPATSIAGVVRHMLGDEATSFFGEQSKTNKKGSEIIFTEAKILDSNSNVVDGLNAADDELLAHFKTLPIRQHVKINSNGVAAQHGKFDEQVVYAGTRFCFELEMLSNGSNYALFERVLSQIKEQSFRIGGGTRCGFGEIKVIEILTRQLNLANNDELQLYVEKSSNLSSKWTGWNRSDIPVEHNQQWTSYTLILKPESFFLFSSGFGDEDADMTPVKECKVIWNNNKGKLSEQMVLFPASSIKGALSHRVAYHWNKHNGYYIGDERAKTGSENFAVKCLFGSEGERVDNQMQNLTRGNVLFSDVIEPLPTRDTVLHHVKIDRLTGGAINGALFNEKTTFGKQIPITLKLLVNNAALNQDIQIVLENALMDICKGLLPLGGGVNRGNGIFTGTLLRESEVIYQ